MKTEEANSKQFPKQEKKQNIVIRTLHWIETRNSIDFKQCNTCKIPAMRVKYQSYTAKVGQ